VCSLDELFAHYHDHIPLILASENERSTEIYSDCVPSSVGDLKGLMELVKRVGRLVSLTFRAGFIIAFNVFGQTLSVECTGYGVDWLRSV
jgi:hypothetical protein